MRRFALVLTLITPLVTFGQAPNLNPVFPCGAQRGTSIELAITGQNLQEPLNLFTTFPIQEVKFKPHPDPSRLVASFKIPGDATLGWHSIRLQTKRGVSNLRSFCIDELPQVLQTGSPFSIEKAQDLNLPCVVCGTIQPEQKHYYSIKLTAGQRLCAEILGRRLGSSLDPSLALYDAATGQQVAFSDDAPGLEKDARIAFTARQAGTYHLEVRDVTGAGGDDRHYRLRLGDFPLASTTFPLAIQRGAKATLTFAGPLVEQTASVELTAPTDPAIQAVFVTPRFANRPGTQAGWPVQVMLTDLNERSASLSRIRLPQQRPATHSEKMNQAISLTPPGAISGILRDKGEKHYYRFRLQAGVRYLITSTTREHGSPALLNLALCDATGNKVANSNSEDEAAQINFTPTREGEFLLTAEHLHYSGGPDQSYRLAITPYRQSFKLTAQVDRLNVSRNKNAILIVQAEREGYLGPILLKIEQPDSLTGSAIIPAGESFAMLPITANGNAPLACKALTIVGTGQSEEVSVREYVRVKADNPLMSSESFVRPAVSSSLPVVDIQSEAPFSLTVDPQYTHAVRGLAYPMHIRIIRQPGFQEEVVVQSLHQPGSQDQRASVSPLTTTISKGVTEVTASHQVGAEVQGHPSLAYLAKAIVDGREVAITTMPMTLAMGQPMVVSTKTTSLAINASSKRSMKARVSPFLVHDLMTGPLGLRPSMLDLGVLPQPFSESSVEVTVVRQGGYTGPIEVSLINLPDKVVAGRANLAAKQDHVVIPIARLAGANALTRNTVQAAATATMLNQKALSQPFSLTIK